MRLTKFLILSQLILAICAADETIVKVCEDMSEWPPFTLYERFGENKEKSNKIVGFSIDVIDNIFSHANIKYKIDLISWNSCLNQIKRGLYDLCPSASYSVERDRDFYLSKQYYFNERHYFYSAKKYPNGLQVKGYDDIKKNYKLCGIYGYSYGDLTPAPILQEFKNYGQLIKFLHERTDACDMFLEGYEVLSGFSMVEKNYLDDPSLKHALVPGSPTQGFSMMFTKNDRGKKLRDIVDAGINRLNSTGEYDIIYKKWIKK